MKNFKAKLFGVSLFVLTLAASCNHDFNKVVPTSPPNTGAVYKTPKVLYIIADGARGVSVRDADIPTLKSLIPNAIYTWNSLSDATVNTDATNWADMITGVKKEKHNVLTEDFAGNSLATYPAIFQRIKSIRPTMRIASFSASSAFKANLTGGTDVSETFTSDDAVKTRMVDFLKADTASLVVGEFAGIEAAGKASGFDNSFPAYKAAINTFDTQLGAILASIKSRANYANENWMIIVSSNKGGPATLLPSQDDKTVFSNTSANTFTIIYNSGFNPTFIGKPFVGNSYTGNSVRFLGYPERGVGQVSKQLSPAFNFGDTSGFTISVKVKKHKNPVTTSRGDYYYNWPGFMGKRGADAQNTPTTGWGNDGASGPGWDFCLIQNTWRFFLAGKNGYKGGSEILGLNFSGDTWHDLTAVIERKPDGHKYVRVYTDGVMGITSRGGGSLANPLTTAYDLAGDGAANGTDVNLDNNSVLRVGYTPGEMDGGTGGATFGKIDVELKELKIFKIAIPDAAVKQYACDQTIDRSHPYYPYLIGYWPMDEGTGTVLNDKGPVAANMTLSQSSANGYSWQSFQDLICSPAATNLALLVPKNADIPTQILSWFNIARQAAWNLDGKVWVAN
ncbi:DUF4983 domain-containing protein [Mucilaginibacter sp. UR6-11]|uniref:DUF4983 domain-containing protein n=1 Tax=Mucilaginibacter sp. UR6-11 TaxID=1435644 RepID=UPI001E2A7834|nr:DUF4983 domain-containing protein [Mucilaginibacter sp. UR6-11]MCC8424886.1 DUF4983 domain-containing protein [Mucilaginibacter sp. UR6-11]